jgi:hypothetical protein
MVFAEDIRRTILKLADERGPEHTFAPADVARSVDKENWPMIMDQVKFVASILIKEGKIIATQAGKSIDITRSDEPFNLRKIA